MNKNEQSAGTKIEQRTTAESGTSASLEQNGLLSAAVQEGNKLMAEILGYKYHQYPDVYALPGWKIPQSKKIPEKLLYNGAIGKRPYLCRTTKEMKFHFSWDWQIPAFGRTAMAVKTLIPKLPNPEKNGKWYFRNLDKYEKATFCNEPFEGFKIILELIKWYNVAIKSYVGSR